VLRPFWKWKGEVAGAVQRKRAAVLGRLRPEEEEIPVEPVRQSEEGRGDESGEGSSPESGEGRAGRLGGKEATRLLGWVKVVWASWAELGKGIGKCVYQFWLLFSRI
jgi:hypothetical protein